MPSACTPILFEAHSTGEETAFACSCHTSLVREITSSSQIQYQDGSSQQSGRPTPLQGTLSSSEPSSGFLPTKLELLSHPGRPSTLLQLKIFLKLPTGTMKPLLPVSTCVICQGFLSRSIVSVPFQWPKPRWLVDFWGFWSCSYCFPPILFLRCK